MKKRIWILLLTAALLFCLSSCQKDGDLAGALSGRLDGIGAQQPAPGPEKEPEKEKEPETGMPAFQVYVYEEGDLSIGVPWSMNPEPELTEGGLRYLDPEGKWTLEFRFLKGRDKEITITNQHGLMLNLTDFGYYRNLREEEVEIGPYKAFFCSFDRNPDWNSATQGYTASYTEAHAFWVVDYGDDVISGFTGLQLNLSVPEDSLDDIEPLLEDEDVRTLLDNLVFGTPDENAGLSFPGVTVSLPASWSGRTNDTDRLEISLGGTLRGTIVLSPSIYADPLTAAGYVSPDYRTITVNGRSWYGELRANTLGESPTYSLHLYTSFSSYHALELYMSYGDAKDPDATWAFAESETFTAFLESMVIDASLFRDPELDRIDESGLECNNVGKISAYTGSASELLIPAAIGSNTITGINVNTFKGNGTLTSVTISEGITSIDSSAFEGCTALKTVILPNSLTTIGNSAFEGCTALETVVFGSGLQVIDSEAFRGCGLLGDVLLGNSIRSINSSAFYEAGSGLGRFVCTASGTVYGSGALSSSRFRSVEIGPDADLSERSILYGCRTASLTIGEGCTALGEQFFTCGTYNDESGMWHYYDDEAAVTLPKSLRSIGEYAFQGRLGLREIDLGQVETLGRSCFSYTGLVDIRVPGTVKEIPDSAFANCADAMTITLEEGVEAVREYAFAEDGRKENMPEMWNWVLTAEQAQKAGDRITANGANPAYDNFLTIRLPSTLKEIDGYSFCWIYIQGLYLEWCQGPDMLPPFATDAFAGCPRIAQVYFTKEVIDQYGDELDAALSKLESMDEPAWYDEGSRMYWSEYGTYAEIGLE